MKDLFPTIWRHRHERHVGMGWKFWNHWGSKSKLPGKIWFKMDKLDNVRGDVMTAYSWCHKKETSL